MATSHRMRYIAQRLADGTANEGDVSEAACLLMQMANDLEDVARVAPEG